MSVIQRAREGRVDYATEDGKGTLETLFEGVDDNIEGVDFPGLENEDKDDKKEDKEDGEETLELKDETGDEKDKEDDEKVKLDEETDTVIPGRKAILKEFPDLFKKFPQLERGMYALQSFREVFPSVKEAQDAQERVETFEKFEQSLFSGTNVEVLKSLRETDSKAFGKVVDNYLDDLQKVDKQAYAHVVLDVVKKFIINAASEGQKRGNEKLQISAAIMNQFAFGTADPQVPTKFSEDSDDRSPEKSDLEREREEFRNERLNTAKGDLDKRVDNIVKSSIEDVIDPKGQMTAFTRKQAIKEILNEANEKLAEDETFNKSQEKLWSKALEKGLNQSEISRIKAAKLARLKVIIPSIMKRVRAEALRDSVKRDDDKDRSGHLPVGGPARQKSPASRTGEKQEDKNKYKGMSTLQILNSGD